MVCCTGASLSYSGIGWSGLGLRFCISNELSRDADVAGLSPTLPGAWVDTNGEFFKNFIYLFIFGCVGSSLLHAGFL